MTGGSHPQRKDSTMKRRLLSGTVSLMLISALFVGLDLSFDIIPKVSSGLIEVDDSGGKDYLTIQEGVDAAIPGDTVFVYSGFYDEDVIIEKTINLTGENRDTTIINGSGGGGSIWARYADFINVSGFTFQNGGTGISIHYSNYSRVENCKSILNQYGIIVSNSNGSVVKGNIASNNSDYHGIYLEGSTNITVKNNTCSNNTAHGIRLQSLSNNNKIANNVCSNNYGGISVGSSTNNLIINNTVDLNSYYGLGIFSDNNTFIENQIISNYVGVRSNALIDDTNRLINCTLVSSTSKDIDKGSLDNLILLNTTFNKSKTSFQGVLSILEVQWYLHINVIDILGNPVPNVNIKIKDNNNGSYNETFSTDSMGYLRWLTVTEYIEQDTDGDTIGEKKYYTPHKIIAWNDTLVGYAQPFMNESKTVTIILYNGTFLELEPGWNLISLPRIQSNTNLQTIVQSIEGQYDAVQWYNITDTNDPWKHNHISKPSNLNDLDEINHTMGFWIYIIDTQGTTLIVFGDVLTITQNITLYPGWNLVGFPSKSNKTRDIALNGIFYGSDIDSIWTYNASIHKWVELDESIDYFEVGQGYWIHSKVTKTWNVPL